MDHNQVTGINEFYLLRRSKLFAYTFYESIKEFSLNFFFFALNGEF